MALPGTKANGTMMGEAREFAATVIKRLGEIAEALRERDTREQVLYHRLALPGALGTVRTELTAPLGALWLVEKVMATQAVNSRLFLYIDSEEPTNLVESVVADATSGHAKAGPGEVVYVPAGRKLLFVWHDQAAATAIAANVRIRQIESVQGVETP